MDENRMVTIGAVAAECHRLAELPRFHDEPMALEALQLVLCWLEEESEE